jgi:hypothetical protein
MTNNKKRHSIQAMRERIARDGTQLGNHQHHKRRLRALAKLLSEED